MNLLFHCCRLTRQEHFLLSPLFIQLEFLPVLEDAVGMLQDRVEAGRFCLGGIGIQLGGRT